MDFQENNFEKSNLVMTPNSDNFGFVQKAAVVRTVSHKLVSLCNVMLLNSHCLRLFLFFPIWLFHIILLFGIIYISAEARITLPPSPPPPPPPPYVKISPPKCFFNCKKVGHPLKFFFKPHLIQGFKTF